MSDPNFMFAEKALEASKNGDYALLGSLKSGNCLHEDYVDQNGATCVHYAARVGKIDVLQYLIRECQFSGARRSLIGATAAHDASATGQLEALRWLLQYTTCSIEDRDESGATCLHLAARFGHSNIVNWLTNEAGVNVMDKTTTGAIPLHFAASKGDLDSVKVLVQKSPRSVDVQMKNGVTVCYLACQEGHLDIVKYLVLEAGASENIKAFDGMCCVHAAAQAGHLDILQWLVEERGCNANDCDVDGSSTVHFAASKGHSDVLKWLLNRGVPFVRDKLGGTALHDGAEAGETEDVNETNGGTPLHDAAKNGHLECVKVLLDFGCDPSVTDIKGLKAVDLADKCNQKECVDLIRGWEQRKAFNRRSSNLSDDSGTTYSPRDSASLNGQETPKDSLSSLNEQMIDAETMTTATTTTTTTNTEENNHNNNSNLSTNQTQAQWRQTRIEETAGQNGMWQTAHVDNNRGQNWLPQTADKWQPPSVVGVNNMVGQIPAPPSCPPPVPPLRQSNRNGLMRIPDPPMIRAPQPPAYNEISRRAVRPDSLNQYPPPTGRINNYQQQQQYSVYPEIHHNNSVVNVNRAPGWESVLPKDESSTDPSSRSSTLRARTENMMNSVNNNNNNAAASPEMKRTMHQTLQPRQNGNDETDSNSSKSSFELMIQKTQRKITRSPTPDSTENVAPPRVIVNQHSPKQGRDSAPPPAPPPPPLISSSAPPIPPPPPPMSNGGRSVSPVSRTSSNVSSNSSQNGGEIQRPGSPSLIQRRCVAQARSMFQQKGAPGDIIAELKNRNMAASLRKTKPLNEGAGGRGTVVFSSSDNKKISSPTSTIVKNLAPDRHVVAPTKPESKPETPSTAHMNGTSSSGNQAPNFSAENFLADVPKTDKSGRDIPQWRRTMLARQLAERAKTDYDLKQKKQKEEERLAKLPPWKREMMQRQEIPNGNSSDKTVDDNKSDTDSGKSIPTTPSTPDKPTVAPPPKPNPKPKLDTPKEEVKPLSPWQQELQRRKTRVP